MSSILATPVALPLLSRPPIAAPRRSRRIAGVGVEMVSQDLCLRSTKKKAMRALKVIGVSEGISPQAREDYAKVLWGSSFC